MTNRLLLGPSLAFIAATAACNGFTTVLESSSTTSTSAPSGSGGSSPSSSSSSSSGSGGTSSSSSSGSGAGGASSSSSGSGGQGGMIADGGVSTVYAADFEGACPNGWTLSGDWECGTPSGSGPSAAFSGTQCIATKLASLYSSLATFATTTATSPSIDLTTAPAPKLSFRMWIDTEGSTYDGANLKVSTDNGLSFSVVTTVAPLYPIMISGEPAWGGHQAALGWQLVNADLSAHAGQIILLRFAFRSDASGQFAGVYIDDVVVTDN